jgi:glycosyltransferase involved in cell wall biosynthesis
MTVANKIDITVLFPVCNAEDYVAEALFSVLAQTYRNFEVIAINDGSTDGSLRILQDIAASDSRVRVIDQPNQGIVKTLNTAAGLAQGRFIARMDSDDYSIRDRFELQHAILNEDPDIVLVAGCFEVMDSDGEYIYREIVPSNDRDIKRAMYVRNPIAHGSVMFRREVFEKLGGYSGDCGPTEDYELWSRMAEHGKFAAIDRTIFRWRVNPGGITTTKQRLVEKHMQANIDHYWRRNHPVILKRSEIMREGMAYIKKHKKHGLYMKTRVTADNIQIGVKLLRRRNYRTGIHQLWEVASTGRTGLRMTTAKLRLITENLIRHRGLEQPTAALAVNPKARVSDTV